MVREKKKIATQNVGAERAERPTTEAGPAPQLDRSLALCIPSTDIAGLKPWVEVCGISVVTLESIWNGTTIGFGAGGQSLQELPTRLLGFLACSSAGSQEVERFRKAWAIHFNRGAPEALSASRQRVDPVEVLGWIARCLVNTQRQMAQRNTSLMRDMYVVRADHEATQEAFQRLETYAYASSMLSRHLALSLEPQKPTIQITKGLNCEVYQLLPTSSAGICDVAVHVAQSPKDPQGRLEVFLQTREDGQTVGKWTIASPQLRTGWLRLGLDQALNVDEGSIALRMQWAGSGEVGFSLSGPHPEARWCATVGGTPAAAPLGVKVWRSLPGTRAIPATHASMNASTEQQTSMLYADTLRKVENLGAIPDGIVFDEQWNSLLVHPVAGRTTWARVNNAVPAGVVQISADIETRNEKAGPVEYAIALAPATEKARKTSSLHFKPGLISDWIYVGSTMQSQVHLHLESAATSDFDLYLGTRLPPGASNAFCWAHFSKIKMVS